MLTMEDEGMSSAEQTRKILVSQNELKKKYFEEAQEYARIEKG